MVQKKRCEWCLGSDIYRSYHDDEWGIPEYDDHKLFEMINLEGAQAGLSWITVLKKRENYRTAFDQFDPVIISKYSDKKIQKLLQNPGIIRNKLKVNGVRKNAIAYLNIKDSGSSFSDYLWDFVDGKTKVNRFKTSQDIPAKTTLSDKISKQLKKDGFTFVGSTITYAFMQACGMVNDHVTSCFRYSQLK